MIRKLRDVKKKSTSKLVIVFLVITVGIGLYIALKGPVLYFLKTNHVDIDRDDLERRVGTIVPLGENNEYYVHFKGDEITIYTSEEGYWNFNEMDLATLLSDSTYEYAYSAELITLNNKDLILLKLNAYDHASYRPYKVVAADPDNRELIYHFNFPATGYYEALEDEGILKLTSAKYKFYSNCEQCGLPLVEILEYDSSTNNLSVANVDHKEYFEELLGHYNDIAENECYYKKNQISVSSLLEQEGSNAKCDDPVLNDNDSLLTVGEFLKLKQSVESILEGENISLLNVISK